MRAKDLAMTTSTPAALMAMGACSRDEMCIRDRTHLVGQLELAFQAAVLVIHLGGHARIAACLHQAERLGAHGIVNARHEDCLLYTSPRA